MACKIISITACSISIRLDSKSICITTPQHHHHHHQQEEEQEQPVFLSSPTEPTQGLLFIMSVILWHHLLSKLGIDTEVL